MNEYSKEQLILEERQAASIPNRSPELPIRPPVGTQESLSFYDAMGDLTAVSMIYVHIHSEDDIVWVDDIAYCPKWELFKKRGTSQFTDEELEVFDYMDGNGYCSASKYYRQIRRDYGAY